MSIQYLDNQPIQLYKVNPTTDELAEGMTAWAETAYHKRLGNCGFIGPNYCHPVLNTDYMTFQFKAATTGSEILVSGFDVVTSGINTSVTTDRLIDAGGSFGSLSLNQLVENVSDDTSAFIEDVTSGTNLLLSDDIFTATPKSYAIYNCFISGNWKYGTTTFSVLTAASGEIEFPSKFTVGLWYKVTIKVTDITAGTLTLKSGATDFATITSVGTHTFFVLASDTSFIVESSSAFVGSWNLFESSIYQMQQYYTLAIFDLDGNYVTGQVINLDDYVGLEIGNGIVNIQWSDFDLDCGNYVIGIAEGQFCVGEMVENGGFSGAGEGWTFDEGVTVFHNTMDFINVGDGMGGVNELACQIIEGHTYTVSFTVAVNQNGDKNGSYGVWTEQGQVSATYNIALQSGTVTFTFTATQDSDTLSFLSAGTLNGSFDNVSLTDETPISEDEVDGLSECLCVCDTQDCTILLKYQNSVNAYGEYFDGSIVNYFRVEATILNSQITDEEYIHFKNTLSRMGLHYYNGIKVHKLATDLLPEWVHNSLAIAIKHDHVLIDGVRYVSIEEYSYTEGQTEIFGAETRLARHNQTNLKNVQ